MSKLVNVIIPTFNRSSVILRAVDSVMKQTFNDFNLTIVDDDSTDNTEKLISDYIKQNSIASDKIKFIKQENRGVSAARNVGVSKTDGKWLSFLDSDDEWLPNKLKKQISFSKENPEIKLIHGEEIWIRNGKRVNPKNKHKKSGGYIYEEAVKLCLISPSATLLKRDLFEEMKGFDEDFVVCEDYDLWLKICSKYEIGFITDPIINKYGGHDDQLSKKFFAMDFWRVKSMFNILNNETLKDSYKGATINEIVYKAEILLKGYKKHNNLINFNEIETILKRTQDLKT